MKQSTSIIILTTLILLHASVNAKCRVFIKLTNILSKTDIVATIVDSTGKGKVHEIEEEYVGNDIELNLKRNLFVDEKGNEIKVDSHKVETQTSSYDYISRIKNEHWFIVDWHVCQFVDSGKVFAKSVVGMKIKLSSNATILII